MLLYRPIIFIKFSLALLTLLIFIPNAISIFKYEHEVYTMNKRIEFKNKKLTAKTNALKSKLYNLNLEEQTATNSLTPSDKKAFLQNMTLWISSIQQRYDLQNTNIVVNKKNGSLKNLYEFYSISESQLQLDFEVEDELQILMFLDEVIEKFPGYIMVNSLEISKENQKRIYITVNLQSYSLEELPPESQSTKLVYYQA